MKSFPENRENIILADCEEEELQEFVEGIQSVIGEKFVIKNKICNGGHGKLTNIKRYLEFENPSSKQVVINYVLLNGINDNKKEILDWFMFSRNLGVKKLSIDIDEKWYNLLDTIPEYLKEILVFTKELSEFNNLEIEFSHRMSNLYEKIQGQ